MALFSKDDYLYCPKCNSRRLMLQDTSLYRMVEQKGEQVLEEENAGAVIRCARCGHVVKELPEHFRHVKK